MTTSHPLFKRPLRPGWRLLKVDDVKSTEKSACVAGPFGSNISSKYFTSEGVPVIRGNNLRDDLTRFVPNGFAFVSRERSEHYKAQHVRADDLVFTCWGTIGQVGLIPRHGPFDEYIISNKQLKLRPNCQLADPVYLFYYLASPEMVSYIRSRAIGAAVPGINLGILKSLPVVLPPMDTQHRIAFILSAFDELIDNNLRRIQLLEELGNALYREWFVKFRFPGHGRARAVESPIGRIPEGWRIARLNDLVITQYGYTESAVEEPVGPHFLRGMDINKSTYIDWNTVPYCPISEVDRHRFLLKKGDIVVIRMADPGKVGMVEADIDAVFASYLVRIEVVSAAVTPMYIFHFLLSDRYQNYIRGASGGSTRKSASASVITGITVLVPPREVIAEFDRCVSNSRKLLSNLVVRNTQLRATRSLLLSKLISGDVDVSTLNIRIPEEPST